MKDKSDQYKTENREWQESIRWILEHEPKERVEELLNLLTIRSKKAWGIAITRIADTLHQYYSTGRRSVLSW